MPSAAVRAGFGEIRTHRGTHPSIQTSISHFSDHTPTSSKHEITLAKTQHGERRGGSGRVWMTNGQMMLRAGWETEEEESSHVHRSAWKLGKPGGPVWGQP